VAPSADCWRQRTRREFRTPFSIQSSQSGESPSVASAGAGLLAALAGHEAEEGFAGAGDECQCGGEVLHLAGGLAVLHGIQVPLGSTGAGASAATRAG
jgi:hypothetical protein